jgi:ribonuclease III
MHTLASVTTPIVVQEESERYARPGRRVGQGPSDSVMLLVDASRCLRLSFGHHVDDLQQLQSDLGYTFRDSTLLGQALVHSSYLNESAELPLSASNERLEFLGDAIVGMLIADELYKRFPDATEGELTEMRAQLVRNAALAKIGERLDLGRSLVMGRGEERTGGRRRAPNLGRALEAIIGAIYLDGGIDAIRGVVVRLFDTTVRALETGGAAPDAKSSLQRLAQAKLRETPSYVTVATEGTADSPEFVVEVHVGKFMAGIGRGRTKRQAQQEAAKQALQSGGEFSLTSAVSGDDRETTDSPLLVYKPKTPSLGINS